MKLFNLFAICMLSIRAYGADYEIAKIWSHEKEDRPLWDAKAMNAHGQIIGNNDELGTIFIDVDGKITTIPKMYGCFNGATAINNNGDVLIRSSDYDTSKSYIWNQTKDLISVDVFNSPKIQAIDINDKNQVIGTYVSYDQSSDDCDDKRNVDGQVRAFLWQNGEAIDISPEYFFANSDYMHHDFRISEINLMCINNRGHIAGYCFLADINEQHGEKVIRRSGFVPFLWDGSELDFLPITFQNNSGLRGMKLNNENIIVISFEDETYVWEGFKFKGDYILPESVDGRSEREAHIPNFEACAINDQGEIFGILQLAGNETGVVSNRIGGTSGRWTRKWALWRAKECTLTFLDDLLGENKIKQDKASIMGIRDLGYFVDINNKGQILGHAFFGPDNNRRICLLNPVSEK